MSDGDAEDTVVIYSTLTDSADLWHVVTQMDQFQFTKRKQSAYQNVSRVRSADAKDTSSSVDLNTFSYLVNGMFQKRLPQGIASATSECVI